MDEGLIDEVRRGLLARKPEWRQMADEIDGVSYSWLSRIALGTYKSSPTYKRLQAVRRYLMENPPRRADRPEVRA